MEKTIEDLKLEADALGITYSKNIGAVKLQEKIDEFYDNESAVNTTPVVVKEEDVKKERVDSRAAALRTIKEQERKNLESVVIKLTMIDKREASTATNQYFGNGDIAMNIPLDVWVEVPRLIAIMAEEAKATIHIETENGAVPKSTKKFVVEYKNGK